MPNRELRGRVALVTGANRGIGAEIAVALAAAGARVVVNHPRAGAEAGAVVSRIAAAGGEALAMEGDISRVEETRACFEAAERRWGPVDILVNNAATDQGRIALADTDEARFEHVLGVNFKGAYFASQCLVRGLKDRTAGAAIINISSVHARTSVPGFSLYASSKGAMEALTRQLAVELAPQGIRVNAIAPGFIEVERIRQEIGDYSREREARTIPLGRVGLPEDIGALVVFLASPAAAFLTGQVITVDGGVSCRLARR